MVPTERARALVEMIHDVHSNEVAWEIAEQCFLREERKQQLAPVLKIEDPTPTFKASSCPQCGAAYDPKTGSWKMASWGWHRRDEIAREIWAMLLGHQFGNIAAVSSLDAEGGVDLVDELAKTAVTYADVLIEALDRREP